MVAFIRASEAAFPPDAATRSFAEQRQLYDAFCRANNPPRAQGVETVTDWVPGPAQAVPVRIYRRTVVEAAGTVVYFHGGGFILGGLDSHDFFTAHLAAVTGLTVVAVKYRLAPEHPYPAARDDARAVLAAIQTDAGRLGLDTSNVFVGGDSAGGNLAAGLSAFNRDRDGPPLKGQFLVYPTLAAHPRAPASVTEADAPLLTLDDIAAYGRLYHGDRLPAADAYAFPLSARHFAGLPPTWVMPVEHDPLRDDAVDYAKELTAAGVPTHVEMGVGLVHGSLRALGSSPGVDACVASLCRWLTERLAPADR